MNSEEQLLDRLTARSAEWKAQFAGTSDVPLKWSIDSDGMLWLDNVRICPVTYVNMAKEKSFWVDEATIELHLNDSNADIIIEDDFEGGLEIAHVERNIHIT